MSPRPDNTTPGAACVCHHAPAEHTTGPCGAVSAIFGYVCQCPEYTNSTDLAAVLVRVAREWAKWSAS